MFREFPDGLRVARDECWWGAEQPSVPGQRRPNIIPGLLQTEAYARAVLTCGLLNPDEAEEHVGIRMERQAAVLDRDQPPVTTFVLDETALLRGDPNMLQDQRRHLLKVGERSRLSSMWSRSLPGCTSGQAGPFVLASLPGSGDVAYLDDQTRGHILTDPDMVAELQGAWDALRAVALPRDQSRDLIRRLVDEHD